MTIQPLADLPRPPGNEILSRLIAQWPDGYMPSLAGLPLAQTDAQANDPVELRRLLRRWIRYARTLTEAGIVAYPTALMVETTAALDRTTPRNP